MVKLQITELVVVKSGKSWFGWRQIILVHRQKEYIFQKKFPGFVPELQQLARLNFGDSTGQAHSPQAC